MIDATLIDRARAVPIVCEIHRRGIMLRRVGAELVGGCPRCGDGGKGVRSNRFAVHPRKNVWLCRRCQRGGNVIELVQHLDGVGFAEAVARLAGGRGQKGFATQHFPADDSHHRAMRLWEEAAPIAGTIAETYLRETRRLTPPPDVSPRVLRFHPRCPFGEGTRHSCLVALYRDVVTDEPRAIMRTALTPDGRKIDRKALGPVGGAAIKLSDDADVTQGLVVGEGLESTLAGMVFGLAPAWALGSVGAIAAFPALAGIECLTVLAETGDGGASARAIRECASRWLAAGREVLTATSLIGDDMNDATAA